MTDDINSSYADRQQCVELIARIKVRGKVLIRRWSLQAFLEAQR